MKLQTLVVVGRAVLMPLFCVWRRCWHLAVAAIKVSVRGANLDYADCKSEFGHGFIVYLGLFSLLMTSAAQSMLTMCLVYLLGCRCKFCGGG